MNIVWAVVVGLFGLLAVLFAVEFNYEYLGEEIANLEQYYDYEVDNPNDLTTLK